MQQKRSYRPAESVPIHSSCIIDPDSREIFYRSDERGAERNGYVRFEGQSSFTTKYVPFGTAVEVV